MAAKETVFGAVAVRRVFPDSRLIAALRRTGGLGHERTHAPQQWHSYSITSSAMGRSAGHELGSSTLYRGVVSLRANAKL